MKGLQRAKPYLHYCFLKKENFWWILLCDLPLHETTVWADPAPAYRACWRKLFNIHSTSLIIKDYFAISASFTRTQVKQNWIDMKFKTNQNTETIVVDLWIRISAQTELYKNGFQYFPKTPTGFNNSYEFLYWGKG